MPDVELDAGRDEPGDAELQRGAVGQRGDGLRYLTPVPVLVSNGAVVFMGFGLFGIVSLIIRLVETPLSAGYGFGGGVGRPV
ncbi:hypothetical protein [Pseudofrankia sp. DC12]|uniref:hypothetical protein n=1 Tax=Pseudofrankia sp. DC12 TaxID=683315 RepID=UPI000698A615|nr:hypothetical protein [Pseudofrankia sp. DC12]